MALNEVFKIAIVDNKLFHMDVKCNEADCYDFSRKSTYGQHSKIGGTRMISSDNVVNLIPYCNARKLNRNLEYQTHYGKNDLIVIT